MEPKTPESVPTDDLFCSRLYQMINMRLEMVVLAQCINWHHLDSHPESITGRPAIDQAGICFGG